MFWRLHEAVLGDSVQLVKSIISEDNYQIISGALLPEVSCSQPQPCFAITTLQDAKNLLRTTSPGEPWLYYNHKDYLVSSWLSRINIKCLNDDFLFIPYALISEKKIEHLGSRFFIRPNSGNKLFTGFDFSSMKELRDNLDYFQLMPDDMCCISSYKKIQPVEYRFWICDGEIIARAPYSWDDSIINMEIPQNVLSLAQCLAQKRSLPQECYVADFAVDMNGEASLIEINSFSTSGFYPGMQLEHFFASLRQFCEKRFEQVW